MLSHPHSMVSRFSVHVPLPVLLRLFFDILTASILSLDVLFDALSYRRRYQFRSALPFIHQAFDSLSASDKPSPRGRGRRGCLRRLRPDLTSFTTGLVNQLPKPKSGSQSRHFKCYNPSWNWDDLLNKQFSQPRTRKRAPHPTIL